MQISDFRRISEKSTVCDAKISGHYVNSLLATSKAKVNGFDEALLLDHQDNIAEGPGENIFLVREKELHTPKTGKILKGITRETVMEIAQKFGYEIFERDISPEELENFDGAFFSGTAAEVTPISEIEFQGKIFSFDTDSARDIREEFFRIVGPENEDSENYFTLI